MEMERSPVIVVMGHIDHGKSTLLDYIRKTNVAEREAGGITQRVNAYEISHHQKNITFIDTPGHEAFSAMREQGAAAADIAILVISVEDGVKPQTLEAKTAIEKNHLPYIVAINKIDKPTANLEWAKRNLTENGIYLEGLGGEAPWAAISAKTGQGVPELLDLVLLVAELAELKKDDRRPAEGYILEARVDPKQGITATVIIRDGTLRRGNYLAVGGDCFRAKKLENFRGENAVTLTAASPAVILGWKIVPPAGARWRAGVNKTEAESLTEATDVSYPQKFHSVTQTLDNGEEKMVPLVIKADTLGALEAIKKEVRKLTVPGVKIKILEAGIGAITESDIKMSSAAADAIIVGFNVKIEKAVKDLAAKYQISCGTFDIIYKLSEWLEMELARRRPVIEEEMVIGTAKIIKLFSQTKNKQIVGGLVIDGRIASGRKTRIKRRDAEIGEGEILELRQQQTAVSEMEKGKQFGALIESRVALAAGDRLEILEIEKK